MSLLLVAIGGAIGAPLRYVLAQHLDGAGRGWPLGTAVANVSASLLLGACVGLSLDSHAFALVGTGFCGALSTYSSFAVQACDLGAGRGTAYALLTVGLGLAACALGFAVTQA